MDTIICGDFNVIDSPLLKPFSWMMGASVNESLPWYPERETLENLFCSHGLKNPLVGRKTHKYFSNQLDHNLVPSRANVVKTNIGKDSWGSDHFPVAVSIRL